jgi:Uncharacterized conserved protein
VLKQVGYSGFNACFGSIAPRVLLSSWERDYDMSKMFIYGRFMTGGHYHQYYMQGQTFLGRGLVEGYKKYAMGGGLDAILPQADDRTEGEVYEVDQKGMHKLDFLHMNTDRFIKGAVKVELDNGETLEAEAYIMK